MPSTATEALDFSSFMMQPSKATKKRFLSALFTAAERDDLETFARFSQLPENTVKELVEMEHKQAKNSSTKFFTTLLLHAFSTNSSIDVVTYIIDVLKADIEHAAAIRNHRHNRPVTPLWAATFFNQSAAVRILVERGAAVNKFTESTKSTPLHVACQNGNQEIVEYLVENGACVDAANKYGQTGLMLACYRGCYNVVKFLVGLAGVNVNRVCNMGKSALHYAVSSKGLAVDDMIELLVSHGAQVTRDEDGLTPPTKCALDGSVNLVKRFTTAKRANATKDGDGSGESLLTNEEKANTLELAGCCLIDRVNLPEKRGDEHFTGRKPTTEEIKDGVRLWLRAERLRMKSGDRLVNYGTSCSLLLSTLEQVAGNFQPVGILEGRPTESEEDEAIVEDYSQSTTFEVILLHAYIRRERIIGALHAASIEQMVRLAEKYANSSRLHLLAYAYESALKSEAQKREWLAQNIGKLHLTSELHLKLLKVLLQPLLILQLVVKCSRSQEATGPEFYSQLFRLLELTVQEMERSASVQQGCNADYKSTSNVHSKMSKGDCNLSVLLTCAVLLSFALLRLINKVPLDDQGSCAAATKRVQAQDDVDEREVDASRLEKLLSRACSCRLRAAGNYTLLHIAALNRIAMHAFLFDSMLNQAAALDSLYLVDHFWVPFPIDMTDFTSEALPDGRLLMLLLRCGAEPNALDVRGNTALHLVALQFVKYVSNGHTFEAPLCTFECDHRDEEAKFSQRSLNQDECGAFRALVDESLRMGARGACLKDTLVTLLNTVRKGNLTVKEDEENHSGLGNLASRDSADRRQDAANTHWHRNDSLNDMSNQHSQDFVIRLNYLITSLALRVLLASTHADICNLNAETYLDILFRARPSLLVSLDTLVGQTDVVGPLKCLCARRIRTLKLEHSGQLPTPVSHFISLH